MYIVVIAWMYVAVMMTVAEATASNGTLLGALFTFLLYGVLPVTVVVYLMGTPARRRAIAARERAELAELRAAARQTQAQGGSNPPDAGGHAAADPVAPVRKEP